MLIRQQIHLGIANSLIEYYVPLDLTALYYKEIAKPMFKAKLVESPDYYSLRRKHLLYYFLPSIVIGVIVNFSSMPVWLTVIAVAIYLASLIFGLKTLRELQSRLQKKIEIDTDNIIIIDNKGTILESISMTDSHIIKIKENYYFEYEGSMELIEEVKGNSREQFIIVEDSHKKRRFDFVIDSHYMKNQLYKIIAQWQSKQYSVELIGR